jgi:hypothetical protein
MMSCYLFDLTNTPCSVYADSSKDPFDDPKVETIVEIFKRLTVSSLHAGIIEA